MLQEIVPLFTITSIITYSIAKLFYRQPRSLYEEIEITEYIDLWSDSDSDYN
jgi:hypothetical protein